MPRHRLLLSLLLLPVLVAGRCRPEAPPDIVDPTDVTPPEVRLQVVSIDPAEGPARKNFPATLYGAGFRTGARSLFGEVEAARVGVVNENTITLTVPALEAGTYDVVVVNPGGERAVLRRGLTVGADDGEACRHLVVYFDYDQFELKEEGRRTLAEAASCLSGSRGGLRVEGHTDERGTTDYNVALGERRAQAVQRYLVGQGVAPGRIQTVSFGEERPAATGSGEAAWSRNRRAEILLQE